jgi:hypothetical protein
MSHSSGEVIKDNQVIGYFEYNGTVDVALPAIWNTMDEVHDNWRKQEWRSCTCSTPQVSEVTLYSSYGSGFHWKSKACLSCRTIVSNHDPHSHWDDPSYDSRPGSPFEDCHNSTCVDGHPFNVWFVTLAGKPVGKHECDWFQASQSIKHLPKEQQLLHRIRMLNTITGAFEDSEPW